MVGDKVLGAGVVGLVPSKNSGTDVIALAGGMAPGGTLLLRDQPLGLGLIGVRQHLQQVSALVYRLPT